MSINDIIIYVMAVFAVLGALDRIIGNRFGLGEKFEEGILALGSLGLAMIGIISLAPVLAKWLNPVITPLFSVLGADPAMFAGSLLANDMGGAPLAVEMAVDPAAGLFSGLIVGAMMGPTIVFNIPIALGIIREEDRPFLAMGILAGIITIPLGALVGGLAAGFSLGMVVRNLIPIIIFAAIIALGLFKFRDGTIKAFSVFGKFVIIVITIGLAAAIVEALTGWTVIDGMAPIEEGFATVGSIAIVLAGAFPLVHVITKVFQKPLLRLGKLLGMNDVAAAGMVATLANSIPMFELMKDMDDRGKIINVAFAVSAAFVFGDHLGFTAGFNADMIVPMIIGKLTGGISAVFLAWLITKNMTPKEERL